MNPPLGYTYSDDSVLCADHALQRGLEDEMNESGLAAAIYSWDEAHSNVVCDVSGCGVIQEQNVPDD